MSIFGKGNMDTLGSVLGGHNTGVLTIHTQQGFMNEARKRSSFIIKWRYVQVRGATRHKHCVCQHKGLAYEEFTEVAYLIMRHFTAVKLSLYYIHNYV